MVTKTGNDKLNTLKNGLAFEEKLSASQPVNMAVSSEEELNVELERGYADMLGGRTKSAEKVFADIRRDYDIR